MTISWVMVPSLARYEDRIVFKGCLPRTSEAACARVKALTFSCTSLGMRPTTRTGQGLRGLSSVWGRVAQTKRTSEYSKKSRLSCYMALRTSRPSLARFSWSVPWSQGQHRVCSVMYGQTVHPVRGLHAIHMFFPGCDHHRPSSLLRRIILITAYAYTPVWPCLGTFSRCTWHVFFGRPI